KARAFRRAIREVHLVFIESVSFCPVDSTRSRFLHPNRGRARKIQGEYVAAQVRQRLCAGFVFNKPCGENDTGLEAPHSRRKLALGVPDIAGTSKRRNRGQG